MAGVPIGLLIDVAQWGAVGLGLYEGYIYYTNGTSMIPNDPLQKALKDFITSLNLGGTTPPLTCQTGYHAANGVCVPDLTCPAGQHIQNGVCVVDTTTGGGTVTPAPAGSPLETVTFTSPVAEAATVAGGTIACGGNIPSGVAVARIGVRLLRGTDASFTLQDWVEVVGWTEKLSPVAGAWSISLPIPLTLTAGRYLLESHIIGTDNTAVWPNKWVNITAAPIVCPAGQHLQNGACVLDTVQCPAGTHLANGQCVPDSTGGGGDTTIPTVAITSPLSGANSASSTIHLTGVASDNVGIAGVFVRIENFPALGTPWTPAIVSGGTWSIDFDAFTTGNFVGPYIFQARADDAAGNMQWSNKVTVNYTPSTGGGTCPAGQKFSNNACESIVVTYNQGGGTIKDIFAPGETMRVTATGFPVATSVEFRLRINQSSVQVLNGTANGSGSATMAMTVPAGQSPTTDAYVMCTGANGLVGRHTISITATGAFGRAYPTYRRSMMRSRLPLRQRVQIARQHAENISIAYR